MSREELRNELVRLRKGRGIYARETVEGVTRLRELSGVQPGDEPEVARERLASWLIRACGKMPADMSATISAALALDGQEPFLADRLARVGQDRGRNQRTMRRTMDQAIEFLIDVALTQEDKHVTGRPGHDPVWRVDGFGALVRLDRPTPEVYEHRRIVAMVDRLESFEVSISLPAVRDQAGSHDGEVDFDLLFGGRIASHRRDGDRVFRWDVDLAEPLSLNEHHQYAVRYVVPEDRPLAPHYAFLPLNPCSTFQLCIQFPAAETGLRVYRLDGAHPRVLDAHTPVGAAVKIDRFGLVRLHFEGLQQGRIYGAMWRSS